MIDHRNAMALALKKAAKAEAERDKTEHPEAARLKKGVRAMPESYLSRLATRANAYWRTRV